jgi:hypothetical protein
MKKLWQIYVKAPWERKILLGAFALALIPILAGLLWEASSAESTEALSKTAQVDTFIPKGFVLVPIDVQNFEALDSILGHFGIVDLFQGGQPNGPKQHLVARNVRILRAPHNPAHFAILVQENQVADILKNSSLFTVIVKRPSASGTEFVKSDVAGPVKRSIVYERE